MSSIDELIGQADSAYKGGDYDKAKELCRKGIKSLEKSDDIASIKSTIRLLNILADSDARQGQWFNSIISLERIIRLTDGHRDFITKASCMIKIGDLFSRSGKWDKARSKYMEAEKIVKNFSNPHLLGLTQAGLGIVSWRKGDSMEAVSNGKKALEIGESIENDELIGKAAGLLSNAWNDMCEYDKSIEVNEKAIEAYKRAGNIFEHSRVLNNHGEIYKVLGDYDKAIKIFNEAVEILYKVDNKRTLGYLYFNLAECHARLGNGPEARKMVNTANEMAARLEDKYLKAYIQMAQGMVESLDGNEDKALDSMEKAEEWMTSLGIPYDSGIIVQEHGLTLLKHGIKVDGMGKLRKALKYFEDAGSKDMIDKVKDHIRKNS